MITEFIVAVGLALIAPLTIIWAADVASKAMSWF